MDHYIQQVQLLRDEVPSFDEYPFSLPAVTKQDKITLHSAVTILVRENSAGKSTLLEARSQLRGDLIRKAVLTTSGFRRGNKQDVPGINGILVQLG